MSSAVTSWDSVQWRISFGGQHLDVSFTCVHMTCGPAPAWILHTIWSMNDRAKLCKAHDAGPFKFHGVSGGEFASQAPHGDRDQQKVEQLQTDMKGKGRAREKWYKNIEDSYCSWLMLVGGSDDFNSAACLASLHIVLPLVIGRAASVFEIAKKRRAKTTTTTTATTTTTTNNHNHKDHNNRNNDNHKKKEEEEGRRRRKKKKEEEEEEGKRKRKRRRRRRRKKKKKKNNNNNKKNSSNNSDNQTKFKHLKFHTIWIKQTIIATSTAAPFTRTASRMRPAV